MGPTPRRATLADLLAVADEKPYYELLDGDLSQKAAPLFRHGRLQARLARLLGAHFGDDADDSEPGSRKSSPVGPAPENPPGAHRYLPLLNVQPPARLRPEPFDAIEYEVADLLGVR